MADQFIFLGNRGNPGDKRGTPQTLIIEIDFNIMVLIPAEANLMVEGLVRSMHGEEEQQLTGEHNHGEQSKQKQGSGSAFSWGYFKERFDNNF